MKKEILLGLYGVRNALAADMRKLFLELAAMGYTGVEFFGDTAGYTPEGVRGVLEESGLSLQGWHAGKTLLDGEALHRTADFLNAIGCPAAIVPALNSRWDDDHEESADAWLRQADWLNQAAAGLRKHGLRAGYHNHDYEFSQVYDGKTAFDIFFGNLDSDILLELDTGNCIQGGGDPVAIMQAAKHAIWLHLKPYSPEKLFDIVLGEDGDANDWPAIIQAGGNAPLIIECENEAGDELDNSKDSIENLIKILG